MLSPALCFILGPTIVLSTLLSKIPQCALFFQVDEAKFHTRIEKEAKEIRNCLIIALLVEA